MNLWESVIYGVIQGFTEFLPVSSSGHLALLPLVLKIEDPGVAFDLAMHLGTALAIIVYFAKKLKFLILGAWEFCRNRGPNNTEVNNGEENTEAFHFVKHIAIATLVTIVCVLVLKKVLGDYGRSSELIAFNLIFFGILMFVADYFFPSQIKDKFYVKEGLLPSILIGVAQAVAVIPGVSRSGITLTMARFLKLDKQSASEFVFILSLPVVFLGIVYKLPELMAEVSSSFSVQNLVIGIVISFVMGISTIHFFLMVIKKIGLGIFTLYRMILGMIILIN